VLRSSVFFIEEEDVRVRTDVTLLILKTRNRELKTMLKKFWNDQSGVIVSAELVLVLTIAVLATIVGLSEVAIAVNTELNDISNAIGALRQCYAFTGFKSNDGGMKGLSRYCGTTWNDLPDNGDFNLTCDLVAGASVTATIEGQY
jgi:hypothetical protein